GAGSSPSRAGDQRQGAADAGIALGSGHDPAAQRVARWFGARAARDDPGPRAGPFSPRRPLDAVVGAGRDGALLMAPGGLARSAKVAAGGRALLRRLGAARVSRSGARLCA